MNKKPYSHILHGVAGDQVPPNLDLAPKILNRIQKRKGSAMQLRTRLITATLLVVIVFTVSFFTVPGMAAAIGRWFGYVPGVGLVREGQIRVLAEPVTVTRDGVTVTVDQVVIDSERTALVYSADGIPSGAIVTGIGKVCAYQAALRLPDGSQLLASPNGDQAWASGYRHRFNYAPLPVTINDATLVISCLFETQPGAAPENWEIPLHFIPASADVTAFPVIEIATSTPSAATETGPSETLPTTLAETAMPRPAGTADGLQAASIKLTLDRAVQMDDGYLIYATLSWRDTPFTLVYVIDASETLHLLDGSGQKMLYELSYDERTGPNVDQRQTTFAIKTAPVQVPGPLTLALDAVAVDLPVDASFSFDAGSDPKPGQTWTLDQDLPLGEYTLRVHSVSATDSGFSVEMSSKNGILYVSLMDKEHPVIGGGGGGGSGNPGDVFSDGFSYADGLPKGLVTISIGSIGVKSTQPLQVQWTPPAASTQQLPTLPAACLTAQVWNTALAQKPALPAAVSGRVLTSSPLDANNTEKWGLVISNLDGSDRRVIEDGRDGAFSPDGALLAYSTLSNGIAILDLATNQTRMLPGTGNGDINPIWSPDGTQIVFNRGMGIFDLFITNPDGTEMQALTHGGVQEWPVGWLADGRLLYTVPGRENEDTVYAVDVHSGTSQEVAQDSLESISPDSQYTIATEDSFGERWLTYIQRVDGSERRLLADASLWVLSPTWSPDGEWLLAGISAADAGSTIGGLIQPRTCEVIPLPAIQGNILSWVAAK